MTRTLHAKGVTTYLPTVITGSFERMRQAMSVIADYCRTNQYAAASIKGIHMDVSFYR